MISYDEEGMGARDHEWEAPAKSKENEKPIESQTYAPMYGSDGNAIRPGTEPASTELVMPLTREAALEEVKYLWESIDSLDKAGKQESEKREKLRADVHKIQTHWNITLADIFRG